MAIFFLNFFFCYLKKISSLRQNDRDHRDISSIFEGPWRVTDELNEMVQYHEEDGQSPLTWPHTIGSTRTWSKCICISSLQVCFRSIFFLILLIWVSFFLDFNEKKIIYSNFNPLRTEEMCQCRRRAYDIVIFCYCTINVYLRLIEPQATAKWKAVTVEKWVAKGRIQKVCTRRVESLAAAFIFVNLITIIYHKLDLSEYLTNENSRKF